MKDPTPSLIGAVDPANVSEDLFHLSKDPLPCRQLNVTLPGHAKNTLHEADDYIESRLASWGYEVEREAVPVQAFRTDTSRPMPHQFAHPEPADPWYEAFNIYAKKTGAKAPDEVIVTIAHKDSQSWLDRAPGAYDNCVGTVGSMEIARVLADYEPARSIWFIWCNEEHWPWTSKTAAVNMAASPLDVLGVLNIDGIGHASQEHFAAGRKANVTRHCTPEGKLLADLMAELNERYNVGLVQTTYQAERPNDDDGSFIKAGIFAAVMINGSVPLKYPDYHSVTDTPEKVDVENVTMAVRLCLATVVHLDLHGAAT
jgi:hypothetical protein